MIRDRIGFGPRGFSQAAKRLAGWTSNLLVTAVVLLVGVVFGRELTAWWKLDPPSSLRPVSLYGSADLGSLGKAETLHYLEFGDMPVRLGRQSVRGDTDTVLQTLRTQVRLGIQRDGPRPRPAGPDEQKMLRGLAGVAPVEQIPGEWRMYQLDRPIPLVVVTSCRGRSPVTDEQEFEDVLGWGLALPSGLGSSQWTLLTCSPTGEAATSATDPLEISLPSGAQRQMQLRSADGGGVLLFSGIGDAEAWWSAIDHWFQQHGWSRLEGRDGTPNGRHGRFENPVLGLEAEVLMENFEDLRVLLTVTRP